ncbi:NAD(P)-dependent oxidoreductase [Pseudomonas putida]|uniref:NAD(P)-dependent oxidoreductase n=1 Tax=Pseudomonas putida TaxID=303 RepID=UPI000E6AFCD6|nr:hypothetical protein CIK02_13680 [Pseudomonas putida]
MVNTSRAELLALGALLESLGKGRHGFAALDLLKQELIFVANHPLLGQPAVLCTPRVEYGSRASMS